MEAPDVLTVYGVDWCGDCRRAKRHLDGSGTSYRFVDPGKDSEAKRIFAAAGYRAISVIATLDGRFLMEPSNTELTRLVQSL